MADRCKFNMMDKSFFCVYIYLYTQSLVFSIYFLISQGSFGCAMQFMLSYAMHLSQILSK